MGLKNGKESVFHIIQLETIGALSLSLSPELWLALIRTIGPQVIEETSASMVMRLRTFLWMSNWFHIVHFAIFTSSAAIVLLKSTSGNVWDQVLDGVATRVTAVILVSYTTCHKMFYMQKQESKPKSQN